VDINELVEKVGGEFVCGRAQVRRGSKYIILGVNSPNGTVMTEAGKAIVDSLNSPKKKTATKKKSASEPVKAKESNGDNKSS
jgi:hypothetical protein